MKHLSSVILLCVGVLLLSGCPKPPKPIDLDAGHAGVNGNAGTSAGAAGSSTAGSGSTTHDAGSAGAAGAVTAGSGAAGSGSAGSTVLDSGTTPIPDDAAVHVVDGGAAPGSCDKACEAYQHCERHQVQCIRAPCPPVVGCVDNTQCGGFAGRPCPGKQTCQDDPRDDCDPNHGGADCGGLCVCIKKAVLCKSGTAWDDTACECIKDAL